MSVGNSATRTPRYQAPPERYEPQCLSSRIVPTSWADKETDERQDRAHMLNAEEVPCDARHSGGFWWVVALKESWRRAGYEQQREGDSERWWPFLMTGCSWKLAAYRVETFRGQERAFVFKCKVLRVPAIISSWFLISESDADCKLLEHCR